MKFFPALLLWIAVAASAVLLAQSPTDTAPAHATLSGVVTKEPGSESVKKALIELIAETQNNGGNYTALTGPEGRFQIENIAPGRYRLFAERTGYQEVDKAPPPRRRPIAHTQRGPGAERSHHSFAGCCSHHRPRH